MNRYRLSTVEGLIALQEELNRLFDHHNRRGGAEESGWPADFFWQPAIDAVEEPERYRILVELPGVTLQDLELHAEGQTLVLTGEKRVPPEAVSEGFLRTEGTYGPFRRLIRLPGPFDSDRIEARLTDGLLTVTVPRKRGA
jgi:HSP20 family protein